MAVDPGRRMAQLADEVHSGPIQVLSATALRLELLTGSVEAAQRQDLLTACADLRASVHALRSLIERAATDIGDDPLT
jgi:hypothetical protein